MFRDCQLYSVVLVRILVTPLETASHELVSDSLFSVYLQEELVITHHADKTLQSFCKFQKKINFKDDDHPNHHDVALLLTRLMSFVLFWNK